MPGSTRVTPPYASVQTVRSPPPVYAEPADPGQPPAVGAPADDDASARALCQTRRMPTEPPSAAERAAFAAHIRRTAPLGDAELSALDGDLRVRRLRPGELFLAAGDRAVDCGAMLAGLTREYYPLDDGREVTRNFAGPGQYVGSLSDLISSQPARSSVVAELDSRIAVVAWRRIRDLVARYTGWADFVVRITERLYLAKAEREFELLALDAEARYQRFRTTHAALEPAIALRHVASYVGITPEHLSRLRRRLGITARAARPGSAARRRTTRAAAPPRSSTRSS
jgi:CRP-like cAMP-binding protein